MSGVAIALYISILDLAIHLRIANNYGYFRDELYYIVAGHHLAFGYVDFPPVIAVLAAFLNVVAGDSLFSIHVVPALAGSAIVVLSSMMAKELGGGRRAQVLAAVAAMFSASFAVSSIFSMDVLDMLWWSVLSLLLIKIIKAENKDPRLWVIFGLFAGIGLMTKLTIAFFLVSLLIALVVSAKRSYLKSRWVLLGASLSLVILSPYILWNYLNNWATVDFFLHHGGLNGSGPFSFLGYQTLIAGVLGIPLVFLGLYYFFRTRSGLPYRVFGFAFLILVLVFTLTNAKPYFLMGAYPVIFAAGSIVVEGVSKNRKRIIWPTYLTGLIIIGVALAPVYAPLLPPQTYVNYYGSLTGAANGASAQQNAGSFPQYLGDRFGWNTMTASVAQVYDSLNTSEKAQACIFTLNYGEASALTILGKVYGLPPVISGHNNYYIWGPGSCSGQVLILVGYTPNEVQSDFARVVVAGNITCTYCMTSEDNLPILVATSPNQTLQSAWPSLKHYN